MKKRIKSFCFRGMIFGGFAPLIYGIVMLILHLCKVDTSSDGLVIFKGIISTYILGFICSGISIIWQEERLGLALQILIHVVSVYICYLIVYLVNNWIPKEPVSLLIFTGIFFGTYLIIWLVIYVVQRIRTKKLNSYLK